MGKIIQFDPDYAQSDILRIRSQERVNQKGIMNPITFIYNRSGERVTFPCQETRNLSDDATLTFGEEPKYYLCSRNVIGKYGETRKKYYRISIKYMDWLEKEENMPAYRSLTGFYARLETDAFGREREKVVRISPRKKILDFPVDTDFRGDIAGFLEKEAV